MNKLALVTIIYYGHMYFLKTHIDSYYYYYYYYYYSCNEKRRKPMSPLRNILLVFPSLLTHSHCT